MHQRILPQMIRPLFCLLYSQYSHYTKSTVSGISCAGAEVPLQQRCHENRTKCKRNVIAKSCRYASIPDVIVLSVSIET